MTTQIDIRRHHHLRADQVRAVMSHLAESLERKFGVLPEWRGDSLHFGRSGVDGFIRTEGDQVHVNASLGMLLAPLKPTVEAEIRRKLDEYFPA